MSGLKRTYHVSSGSDMPSAYKRKRTYNKPTGITTTVNKKVKALVKKAISQQAEKKEFIGYAANQLCNIGSAAVYPFTAAISPQPAQGTADGQRIGNKIRALKGWVRGFVNIRPYDVVVNTPLPPIWVRVMVVGFARENTTTITQTNMLTDYFNVNAGTTGFQSNMLDMTLPINKDSWHTYHDIVFKLGVTSTSSTTPVTSGAYFDNSDMSCRFDLSLDNLGVCTFNDTQTVPFNKNRWLVIQPVSADGTTNGNQYVAECHYSFLYEYNDM